MVFGVCLWFGTSKGGKAGHMEIETQMFGKEIFAGLSLTMGHREDFDTMGLAMFLPV